MRKITVILFLMLTLVGCFQKTEKGENPSNTQTIPELESSNTGGGNDDTTQEVSR